MVQPISASSLPQPTDTMPSLSQVKAHVLTEAIAQVHQTAHVAHRSTQMTLAITLISSCLSLAGVVLLLGGQLSEGTVTTASGLLSGMSAAQMNKDAGDRLQDANERLDKLVAMLTEEVN